MLDLVLFTTIMMVNKNLRSNVSTKVLWLLK